MHQAKAVLHHIHEDGNSALLRTLKLNKLGVVEHKVAQVLPVQGRVVAPQILLVLLGHVVLVRALAQKFLGAAHVLEEGALRLEVDQVDDLVVLGLGGQRPDQAFSVVQHVISAFATPVLL